MTKKKMHAERSVEIMERFLINKEYPKNKIEKIKQIILDHFTSYRKANGNAKSIEGKIIYGADKIVFITDKSTYEKFPWHYFIESRDMVEKHKLNRF